MKWRFTCLLFNIMLLVTAKTFAQVPNQVTIYVSAASGNDGNTGVQPDKAFKTLRKAVDVMRQSTAIEIDILVENGTYYPYDENGPLTNVADASFLLFRKENMQTARKLKVLGGYDFASMTRNIPNRPTVLNGGGKVNHVVVVSNVYSIADSLEISGFTITGGLASGGNYVQYTPDISVNQSSGAGIQVADCSSSKILIRNCIISGNTSYAGGGLSCVNNTGVVTVTNCVFQNNTAVYRAGLTDQTGRVIATAYGGAVQCIFSNLKLLGSVFYTNSAVYGTVIYQQNTAAETLTVSNCTLVNNRPASSSAPYTILLEKAGRIELTNSIFWNNAFGSAVSTLHLAGTVAEDQDLPQTGSIYVTHNQFETSESQYNCGASVIWPVSAGSPFTNVDSPTGPDGKWMTDDDGLQLNACLENLSAPNSGRDDFPGALISTDITGRPRIAGGRVDFGAYENPFAGVNFYPDNDKDGHGSPSGTPIKVCALTQGYAPNNDDCDDNDNTVYPGAPEICDDKDNNCNGQVNEGLALVLNIPDKDGDGYGDPNSLESRLFCGIKPGYSANSLDCDDNDANINPGTVWVLDNDKDGYYGVSAVTQCTSPGTGYAIKTTQQAGDCDDNDNTVYPGAPDICDDKDNDCNGGIDDDFHYQKKYYLDSDGDGFGYSQDYVLNCSPVFGRVTVDGDCDDNNAAVNPGATEVCGNNKDDNCNGVTDEGCSTTTVTSFILVNATSDKDIKTLTNGTVIDLATVAGRAINIRANTSPAKVGSVKFVLTGKQSKTQTDNALPYALFSDNGGNYNSWQPAPGTYTLMATPYAGSNGTGVAGAPLTLSFTVVDNTPKISGFVLVNATSDKDIKTLTNGAVIDLAVTPAINIRANPVGNVGSVRFALNSTVNYKTENTAPFAIAGNSGGDYSNWNIAPGTYTLKATPYSADNASGTAGTPNTITITVKRSRNARPAITTTEAGSEGNKVAENKSGGLSLYPNPTSGNITVELQTGATDGLARLELIDLTYRTLLVETGTLVKGTLRKQMQLPATAAAGVYLLRVVVAGKVYQAKLVYAR